MFSLYIVFCVHRVRIVYIVHSVHVVYIVHYRYERLSLDLDAHLKQPLEALAAVEAALGDEMVRGGRRMMLLQRAEKLGRARKGALAPQLERLQEQWGEEWDCPTAESLPTVTVQGRLCSKEGQSGTKSVFQVSHSDGSVEFCSVEELVKLHYSSMGLGEGLHAEGAVFNSLLGLLLWDTIYQDLPDVFRAPGQALPLDWDSDHFYSARKEEIEARLLELGSYSREQMGEEVGRLAGLYQGVTSLVSWSHFSPSTLAALATCMEPSGLVAVMARMARNHRHWRSGLPDLTVWDSATGQLRMVEVKGPGDRLSTKQILWVRFLNSVGITAEVCHVSPTGSKGLVGSGSAPTLGKKSHKKKEKVQEKELDKEQELEEKQEEKVQNVKTVKSRSRKAKRKGVA